MDRKIVYSGAIPLDVDLLDTNKNTMVGLGFLMRAILGDGTYVAGLACTPTGPAGMTVNVGSGSIYALENVDNSAYGSEAADTTNQIIKQGIIEGTTNLSCPAPATTGQSIVYLVEAAYEDVDMGSTVLPYYNPTNPAVPYAGPNNTGVSQNTTRAGVCNLQLKAGVAATTGSQTTPAPDAGYVGLWAITVANGQTTITSGSIAQLSTAPFISPKLTTLIAGIQSGQYVFAQDTSGSANTITVALTPAIASYPTGQRIVVKVANTTTTNAAVMNANGLGNVALFDPAGNALLPGALQANGVYTFVYDGAHFVLQTPTTLKKKKVAVFQTTGTFTVPNDVTTLDKVTVTGGGGGGAGATNNTSGGGGQAGGTAVAYGLAVTAGAAMTATIGAGGTGGNGTPTSGSAGGASTFSSLTGNGGGGGFYQGTGGGSAGTATGGSIDITGGGGGAGAVIANICSGIGGSSVWGSGGNGVNNGNAGASGVAPGSGGSGAAGSSSAGFAGGTGATGIVVIEYMSAL